MKISNHAIVVLDSQAIMAPLFRQGRFLGEARTPITDILPLIADPRVKVLGFAVLTGDGWVTRRPAAEAYRACCNQP